MRCMGERLCCSYHERATHMPSSVHIRAHQHAHMYMSIPSLYVRYVVHHPWQQHQHQCVPSVELELLLHVCVCAMCHVSCVCLSRISSHHMLFMHVQRCASMTREPVPTCTWLWIRLCLLCLCRSGTGIRGIWIYGTCMHVSILSVTSMSDHYSVRDRMPGVTCGCACVMCCCMVAMYCCMLV